MGLTLDFMFDVFNENHGKDIDFLLIAGTMFWNC